MHMITIIEEAFVWTCRRGIYRQSKLYHRNGELFAAHGGGFVGLYRDGATSDPNLRWLDISAQVAAFPSRLGRLCATLSELRKISA